PKEKRTPVQPVDTDGVATSWGPSPSFDTPSPQMPGQNNRFFNRFFLGSIIFFVLALGIAAFIFFGGLNTISSNNVDVAVTAPSSISSGEDLDIGLSVINSNRTNLENAVLYVDYPQGTFA